MDAEETIKIGDTVEITFTGEVIYFDMMGNFSVLTSYDGFDPGQVRGVRREMITKLDRPIKVGDVIKGEQAYSLPIGSVVLYEPGGGASIKISEDKWVSGAVHSPQPYLPTWVSADLRVLHLGSGQRVVVG